VACAQTESRCVGETFREHSHPKPAQLSRGLGTALTEALAVAAVDLGFHKMIGKLFTDNLASIRLVERCRFSRVGLHRRHGQLDGEWRDVLVVERQLRARDYGSTSATIKPS